MPRTPVSEQTPVYDYESFSTIAGDFDPIDADRPYTVQYRHVSARLFDRLRSLALVTLALCAEIAFLVWLLWPTHFPVNDGTYKFWISMAMVTSIGLIEVMRLVNVVALVRSTLLARHPVPVAPEPGHRLAFLTTIVPTKEPVEMAEKTLLAAKEIRYDGVLDIFLLDEGNDPEVKAMCERIGVRHFTRKGIDKFNREVGRNRKKTKHGNYNAWLDTFGDDYDFWVSVDTDHVPLPNFVERLMGYMRDPDVAFVVGPQVYGQNYDNPITKWSESQQYLFHSVLQPAGNATDSAMFVGTNNAVRISALESIDGLADSITEDAATSLVWHSSKNPATGKKWKSVYTPDVLAVGEGPSSWGEYFVQQNRWARGTNEVMVRKFRKHVFKLAPRRTLYYLLLMSYYPSAALAWILGTLNMSTYLITGIGGVTVAANLWLMFYVNAAVLQVGIYFWNRRHNVSPHEESGSAGIAGMFVSALSAPMYVAALMDAIRGRNVPFAVTPKGQGGEDHDDWSNFRKNFMWASILLGALITSFALGHDLGIMRFWACVGLTVTLLPVILWRIFRFRSRRAARRALAKIPVQGTGHQIVLNDEDVVIDVREKTVRRTLETYPLPAFSAPEVIDLRDGSAYPDKTEDREEQK